MVESGPPLLLARALRAAAPDIPMVYRASDDVRLLNLHPMITDQELTAAPLFDRISVASPLLARRWAGHPGLAIDPVGSRNLNSQPHSPTRFPNPRQDRSRLRGHDLFDMDQALRLARPGPTGGSPSSGGSGRAPIPSRPTFT